MSELKPCPFCGKQHEWEDAIDMHFGRNKSIVCRHKVLFVAYDESDRKTITDLFNLRPIEDALLTRAEAAERSLAALREQTRWIPCSERMPEEGQEIYARERGGIITRFKYSNKLRDIFMRHYTHWNWMPLPKPPVTPD